VIHLCKSTGQMSSQQLLRITRNDERREAEMRGQEPALVVRELDPAVQPRTISGSPQRDARYRRLLLAADLVSGAVVVLAAALLGKSTEVTAQSAVVALAAPLIAKIIGLYDHDPARLRKSTLDELPALAQFAALMSFLALVSAPVIFDGIVGPREAIVLVVFVFWSLATGRVVARRIGRRLISPERCLFIGPADEALRFGQKLGHDHATNATLVAHIDIENTSTWGSPMVIDRAVADARELVRRLEVQRVIIAPHSPAGGDTLDLMRALGATGARQRDSRLPAGGRISGGVRRRAWRGRPGLAVVQPPALVENGEADVRSVRRGARIRHCRPRNGFSRAVGQAHLARTGLLPPKSASDGAGVCSSC
jgi:hypothetical protein